MVFAFGLAPSAGSGLTFETLPIAFGQMNGGAFFGSLFFILLFAAALSSCIGCAEAVAFWIGQKFGIRRELSILYSTIAAWFVGLTTIFSLGAWSGFYPLDFIPAFAGRNIYDATDFLAVNTLLPVGGLLISLFFGWWVPRNINLESIGISDTVAFRVWRFLVRYFIPPVLLVVLITGLRG